MLCLLFSHSKRKIEDFLNTLDGFRVTSDVMTKLQDSAQNFRLIRLLFSIVVIESCLLSHAVSFSED